MRNQDVEICPKVQKHLEKLKNESAACIPIFSGEQKIEVRHMYGEQFAVDLENGTCDYRRWELTGIPCSHVISCCGWKGTDPKVYVYEYYKKSAYMRAYEPVMNPINGPIG
ncbi:hypothetical protein ACH5RR_009837 [Cinchona calisaya]|uniref:Zinc finger PMZ-type domain-containing protein n=1 Tax=Cinchona calisaya TaxID=153742 RepID=A0ABD3AHX9_9GENT